MPTFRCSSNTLIKAIKTETKIKILIQCVCVCQRWMLSVLLGSTIHDVVGPNYIYRIFPQVDSVFS